MISIKCYCADVKGFPVSLREKRTLDVNNQILNKDLDIVVITWCSLCVINHTIKHLFVVITFNVFVIIHELIQHITVLFFNKCYEYL